MQHLWLLLIWLGISTVYLVDSFLITVLMGPFAGPAVRQEWLAAPLAFTLAALLFTPWAPWAAAFLLAALALHLAGHLRGTGRVERLLVPASPEVAGRVDRLAARWGTARPDRVLVDPTDTLEPGVMGLWRQALILPRSVLALEDGGFEAVVAHELAHVAARDPLKLWLARFARALLGWHPTARQMAEGIALEVEMEADRRATAWLGDAESYALTLGRWGLRQANRLASPFGVALTGTSSHLVLRLKSLLNPTAPPPHLEIPRWVPGGPAAWRGREAEPRPQRPLAGVLLRWIHLLLTAGYLALFLLLTRLV
jgi:hypothetical protein